MNIFVGNLSFEAAEADVQKLFEGFGDVARVAIVMRKEKKTAKSRGFGFVEMPDEQQALAALAALNGREFMGRVLNTSPARPKTEAQPFNRPLVFKDGGRRTRSYMKRRGLAGIQEEAKPRRNKYDNPMRWRKRGEQPRPWEKSSAEHKPWKKSTGKFEPWKKPAAEARPWSKSSAPAQKSRFKIRGKSDGHKR